RDGVDVNPLLFERRDGVDVNPLLFERRDGVDFGGVMGYSSTT
ncbi:MAG: hypothetical protein G01um101448_1027, partial [Parcubacteria group bacterium Gr01-1014_48]